MNSNTNARLFKHRNEGNDHEAGCRCDHCHELKCLREYDVAVRKGMKAMKTMPHGDKTRYRRREKHRAPYDG